MPAKRKKRKQKAADPLRDAEQHARFVEAAKELEADESGKAFERAFEKIVPVEKKSRQ